MRPPIDDATALITGASSGLGLELARQLAPRVAQLVLVARRRERLEALAAELTQQRPALKVAVVPCDLADLADAGAMLDRVAAEVGPVDLLINNAGLGDVSLLEFADWPKLQMMFRVNIEALTYLSHRLLPTMLARGRGGILNISSGFGVTWMPGMAAYVGSKHYVTAFTESLRTELRGTGVSVTQSCPGPVATEFEAVAGNPTGRRVPSFVQIDAAKCVRQTLRAFERGRAMVITGFWIKLLTWLGMATPRPVMRLAYGFIGRYLRRRQSALGGPAAAALPAERPKVAVSPESRS